MTDSEESFQSLACFWGENERAQERPSLLSSQMVTSGRPKCDLSMQEKSDTSKRDQGPKTGFEKTCKSYMRGLISA